VDDFAVLARWRRWLRAMGDSEHTIRLYSYGVFRLLTEHVEGPIESATEEHIVSFLMAMGDRSTAKAQYLTGIRSLFTYCEARGWVKDNPAALIRARHPRRPKPVALTEEELTRFMLAAAWRDPRRAWTLLLVFGLGTRRMEAAAIRPEDIDGESVLLRECKYGKERRVELSRYARIALAELQPWWNGTVLGGIDRQTITAWAHQAAIDSGLYAKVRRRPAHILRASFASHLLNAGTPVQVVRDLLGHESIATTDVYAALIDERKDRRDAVARLDFARAGGAQSRLPPGRSPS
jgi:site-specific recombinase XerD